VEGVSDDATGPEDEGDASSAGRVHTSIVRGRGTSRHALRRETLLAP
jgi:hypothetical protein